MTLSSNEFVAASAAVTGSTAGAANGTRSKFRLGRNSYEACPGHITPNVTCVNARWREWWPGGAAPHGISRYLSVNPADKL